MWKIIFDKKAEESLKKIERTIEKKIIRYMEVKVSVLQNPRLIGKPLTGNKKGLWRYRVGDYRVVCDIKDSEIMILVVDADHRKNIYDK